jgi:predicted amidohydrolase
MKIALVQIYWEKAQEGRNVTRTIEFADRAAAAGVDVAYHPRAVLSVWLYGFMTVSQARGGLPRPWG